MDYSDIIIESKKIGLPVYSILKIFFILKNGEKIENNLLVQRTGIASGTLNTVKKDFANFFTPVSHTTSLNEIGVVFAQNVTREFEQIDHLIFDVVNIHHEKLTSILREYEDLRPTAKRELDQFIATVETVKKRAILMHALADVNQKKILFLGDDDFTSVAVASFACAKEVVVADIDTRILEKINDISKAEDLNINTVYYDAREKLPANLVEKFDVVFTDPPYTVSGVELFTSRAINGLDPENNSGRVYVCYGNSDRAKERYVSVYESFVKMGLMMRLIFDKFNRYTGAESIGSTSSLFVCDVTPRTKPIVKGAYGNENFYTTK